MVKLLAARHRNVAVVADDDEAIYKWRGAAISNVRGFLALPGHRRIVLVVNYRSHQGILDGAYRFVIHNNPDRLEVESGHREPSARGTATAGTPAHLTSRRPRRRRTWSLT